MTDLYNLLFFKTVSNVAVKKKKLSAKNELSLKGKHSKKGHSQLQPSTKKSAAHPKLPPAGKRQVLVDNRHLVKVPWSVSTELFTCSSIYNKFEILKK